jgi:hypothetical protein
MRTAAGRLLAALGLLATLAAHAWSQADPDRLRNAKALVLDRRYTEARQEWQAILAVARDEDEAAFWIAYCSEKLLDTERAFREYGEYLARKPLDATRVLEARTSRVGLAARLYEVGKKDHLPVLTEALSDGDKTVRYYAALQLADLGKDVGRSAVPVLKEIVTKEKDEELVGRARLKILKIDPDALTEVRPRPTPTPGNSRPRGATWVKVEVFRRGRPTPEVRVNLPLGLAELIYDSLPDDARRELKGKGFDAEKFWKKLRGMAPSEILKIETKDGEVIQIRLE